MIKNYKACREKAEIFSKVFILKNNQPDAVLFSITEYERLSVFIEYLECLEGIDIETFLKMLPKEGKKAIYSMKNLKSDLQ